MAVVGAVVAAGGVAVDAARAVVRWVTRHSMEHALMHAGASVRWHPDVEGQVTQHGSVLRVKLTRQGRPLLLLDMAEPLWKALCTSDPMATGPKDYPGWQEKFLHICDVLRARGVLLPANAAACVQLLVGPTEALHSWQTPAERPLHIAILAGDEVALQQHYPAFLQNSLPTTLVCTLAVTPRYLDLGPVRLPHEACPPNSRKARPQAYPGWRDRLHDGLGAVRELFLTACTGPGWYGLTARGMRLAWQWEESQHPYILQSQIVTQPPHCPPLYYARARIAEGLQASGTAESPAAAVCAAQCEAWERFCMERPDLATAARAPTPDLTDCPGISFDYLRSLTQPLQTGPARCEGFFVEGGDPCALPTQWVYFQDEPSHATNTSGAAYGSTLFDAMTSARWELIERHALLRAYLQGVRGRQLPADSLASGTQALTGRTGPERHVRWYHLSTCNDVHVVACVLTSSSPPYMSLGTAARPSLSDAARKAFYETAVMEVDWAEAVAELGPAGFVRRAETLRTSGQTLGLVEGAWVWAGMPDAGERLHGLFHHDAVPVETLDESKFVAVELGARIVPRGHVVKVLHPDALPLPSCSSDAARLASMLGVPLLLPLPLA